MEAITTTFEPPTGSESRSVATALFAPLRDAWLSARARWSLLATHGAAVAAVSVETYYGHVVLAGDVASGDVRDRAESTVRTLAGVVGVSNRIRVCGTHGRRIGTSDGEVRAELSARRRRARALRGRRVQVGDVYDGVVTLTGIARSPQARAIAFDLAIHAPGVRRVVRDVALHATADAGRRAADAA